MLIEEISMVTAQIAKFPGLFSFGEGRLESAAKRRIFPIYTYKYPKYIYE
jgi:hypothetical protein